MKMPTHKPIRSLRTLLAGLLIAAELGSDGDLMRSAAA